MKDVSGCGPAYRGIAITCVLGMVLAGALVPTTVRADSRAPAGGALPPDVAAALARSGQVTSAADAADQEPRPTERAAQPAAAATAQIQEINPSTGGGVALPGDNQRSVAPLMPARLALHAGEAIVRRMPTSLRRVAVGDGEIVNVFTVGKSEVVLIGSKPGETNIHLWMHDGSQRDVAVNVAGERSDAAAETVRQVIGDVPGMQIRTIGSHIVVTGKEMDLATRTKLEALQKVYPQILNFVGNNPVEMKPMVMMDVTIMEFNKNAVEDLGIRWDSTIAGPSGGLIRDWRGNNYFRVLPEGNQTFDDVKDNLPTRFSHAQGYFGIASTIASQINLLMSRGKAWVLAEPKLSAKSGSSASFLVGGEVPIPIPAGFGQTQIEYKEYGIRLNISPSVNTNNEVSTSIMTEVSRVDPSVSVQGVPGFLTRRADTEINVKAGETIVISGLLDREASKSVDKLPILGDIPILGKLFRSDGFRGNKTELVIFVTPHVVSPTSPENLRELDRSGEMIRSMGSDISPRQNTLVQ
ncbi:type II and III secretion system protein family protein [Xanthomonas massiliensis]|uniref:type II and III secretion system protein family protein n=1 Tax=Xanthomonas massiliensis TaxID=1720302 RepID=UPI000AE7117C|nr:pilus assembly protein N-terminal domain-containing protein [Xanthomonas massiliensis]